MIQIRDSSSMYILKFLNYLKKIRLSFKLLPNLIYHPKGILKIHSDYLMLQNRQKVDSILKENKDNLEVFLTGIRFFKGK